MLPPFVLPADFSRERQERYFCKVLAMLDAASEDLCRSSREVHVLHPASWLDRQAFVQEVVGQTCRRWLDQPESVTGWFLKGVVDSSQISVSKERGTLLLLDDGRYAIPSRANLYATRSELYIPASQLQPLDPDVPARLELIYDQLHTLATPEA